MTIGVNKGTPSQGDLQLFTNKNRVVSASLDFDGYSILSSPEHGALKLENNGQSFSYQPKAGFSGTDEFKLKVVFDGQEYIKPVAVKVYNTESPNQMAMDDVVVTPVNTPVSFNVRSNDIGNLMVRNWLVPTDFWQIIQYHRNWQCYVYAQSWIFRRSNIYIQIRQPV